MPVCCMHALWKFLFSFQCLYDDLQAPPGNRLIGKTVKQEAESPMMCGFVLRLKETQGNALAGFEAGELWKHPTT